MQLPFFIRIAVATAFAFALPVNGADLSLKPVLSEQKKLRAVLTLTNNEAQIRRDWESTSPPQIQTVDRATKGDKISTVTVFEGCTAGLGGACDVRAKFALETPDGKRIDAGAGSLWSSKPLDARFMLGAASATIPIGADWPAGKYVVFVTITDRVASRTIELTTPFEVRP